jgi:hypothetical protein
MNELGLVAIGVVLTLACGWSMCWIDRDEARRRRQLADAILRRHGMAAELYVASAGISDPELAGALDELANRGYIVVDDKDCVIGDLCPRTRRGHQLRIVSDFK